MKTVLENHALSYGVGLFVVMNKAKWESLPRDLQQFVDAVNEEYMEKYAKDWVDGEKEGLDYGISKGVKVITVPKEEQAKWAEKLKPIYDKYVNMTKTKGLPGDEALKLCLDYIKAHP